MTRSTAASVLVILRDAGGHLPVAEICLAAKASAAAVVGAIATLNQTGFEIEMHPHLGGRLVREPRQLAAPGIESRVKGERVSWSIHCHNEVGSTNDEVLRLGDLGAPAFSVVFAESQTVGRGRMGRAWHSGDGLGLWFTILLRPEFPVALWPRLSLWAASGVALGIENHTDLATGIKWPNDILIRDRKVCGILLESRISQNGGCVAAGIGINVNQRAFPPDVMETAGSLSILAGRSFDRGALAAAVLDSLADLYPHEASGFERILTTWKQRSTLTGQRITLAASGVRIQGTARGVTPGGELILDLEDGSTRTFHHGEATLHRGTP